MKKIVFAGSFIFSSILAVAQQTQGKVTYQRVTNLEARFNINGVEQVVPQTRKENFELHFANNQSLWKATEQEQEDEGPGGDHGGVQIRMVVAGANDVMFCNFDNKTKVEKRELFDKTFIVDDSIRPLKWKMTGETKTILNHKCMKATATNIRQVTRMTMDDGKMERKEVSDTSNITVWFTSEVPVMAGPGEFQGQLPGLILEVDVNNGKQTYQAVELTEKADLSEIKEPSGKKHLTPEEFKKEREKLMKEMEENMPGGGGRRIRMN
ncbi:MAG: GLPGLI family protein [Chitinophagaceae bacterium]|nr:GLPGLI family protein [Chitinophagaceae bacterium]